MKRLLPLILLGLIPTAAFAWNATSTSFYVRQNIQSISGGNATSSYSTSTSFMLLSAGGQTAVGTSSPGATYSLGSGILQNLNESVRPEYTLAHYHWRQDDGNEAAATSATGSEDTPNSTITKLATARLRVAISNEGGTEAAYAAQTLRLEYGVKATTCADIVSWTDVGENGGHWDMSDSANLTNGANTTNIATATGGVSDPNHTFISSNAGVRDTGSSLGALSISSDSFVEAEFSIEATSSATDDGDYCFRVTNAGSTTDFVYEEYPEATISVAMSFSTTHTNFPSITPGIPTFATTTLSVSTSNSSGWNVILSGDDQGPSDTVMDLTTDAAVGIADQLEWIPGAATTSAGNAVRINSFDNSGDVLAFRVMTASGTTAFRASSWWGSTDSYVDSATTLWAGIASSTATNKKIGNTNVSSGGSPVLSSVVYYLDVPANQQQGSYSGDITYTASANP